MNIDKNERPYILEIPTSKATLRVNDEKHLR
jgi:hypothetical protein